MEYLSSKKQVVLVGLNPTEQALKHGAVFCQTNGLWQIIKCSNLMPNGVIYDKIPLSNEKDGKYKNFAPVIFGVNTFLGFLDLVPDDYNKKSNNVKITKQHLDDFHSKFEKTNVKKVGLLGIKVTKALFPELEANIPYGKLSQTITAGANKIEVYCLPFPETAPMLREKKVDFYNMLKISE